MMPETQVDTVNVDTHEARGRLLAIRMHPGWNYENQDCSEIKMRRGRAKTGYAVFGVLVWRFCLHY
jgi:hypothetical protein